jgi:hypothetical protein
MPKRISTIEFIGVWTAAFAFSLAIWAGVIYGAYLIVKEIFST